MKTLLNEFKTFAMRGNVIDLAVGVVIGTAFGKVVSSLVENIIMPPLGLILGGVNFKNLNIALNPWSETPVFLQYGAFIQTIVDFVIIAFAIFIAIRFINKFSKKKEVPPPSKSAELLVLEDIRDSLKK